MHLEVTLACYGRLQQPIRQNKKKSHIQRHMSPFNASGLWAEGGCDNMCSYVDAS